MNGPEHFSYAELLLDQAGAADLDSLHERYLIAKAQVHATLALAAATIAAANVTESRVGARWLEATSSTPAAGR